jgi:hypothetical protein
LDYSVDVYVDKIDNITISGFDQPKYCMDDPQFTPTGYPASGVSGGITSTGVFSGNGIVGTKFIPAQAQRGINWITYEVTNSTGCTLKDSVGITVNTLPITALKANFECTGSISETVEFINLTTSDDPIEQYIWTVEGIKYPVTLPTPFNKLFGTMGVKPISLYARTINGCEWTADSSIIVSEIPDASFGLNNECFSPDDSTLISTASSSDVSHYKWTIDGNVFEGKTLNKKNYKFPTEGSFIISLAITVKGCVKTRTDTVNIQPFIKFSELPNMIYSQNFNGSTCDWVSRPVTGTFKTWKRGTPIGSIFNSSNTGVKWYTDRNTDNKNKIESSQVVSPCFDLRGLSKPMIKLSIWSAPEPGRDGAVLQYSLDSTKTWINLGESGKGINWYSSGNIMSKPGNQFSGWSVDPIMKNWDDAKYSLDDLIGQSTVRFRIAYAADGNAVKTFSGFAFDDVQIGERQQMVLNEYFTNVADTTHYYMKSYELRKTEDVLPIHYFGDGELYNYYPAGPSSRIFYYGVTQLPSVFTNGQIPSILSSANDTTEFERLSDIEALKEPKILINITRPQKDLVVTLKALRNLKDTSLVLYCAAIKDTIKVGDNYYYNVLRKFYPNPGGILVPSGGLTEGQFATPITIPLNLESEMVGSKLLIFVQNSNTNKIYQTATYKVETTTSIDPNNVTNLVDVYPNPTSSYLMIDCEHTIDRLLVYDVTGRLVKSLQPFQARFSIPVQDLENGIYIIKGSTNKGEFVKKFIKQ